MAQIVFDLITDPGTITPLLPATPHPGGDQVTSDHTQGAAHTSGRATDNPTVGQPTDDPVTKTGLLAGYAVTTPPPACAGIRVEPKVSLNVTIPFQVLAALWAGKPPPTGTGWVEAAGHGPIPTDALAAILDKYGKRAIWRCQVLDDRPDSPTYGTLIAIGRAATDPGYMPSPFVKALVKANRPRCSHPGCGRPAIDADLDHVTAYGKGGTTGEQNLAPLCRFHHLLKTHAGFTPTLDPVTGQITWRTPSGHLVNEPPDAPPPLAAEGDLPGAWPEGPTAPPF